MKRTITRNDKIIAVPWGQMDFSPSVSPSPSSASTPTATPPLPQSVILTLKTGPEIPSSGLHWHEKHTEHIQILQGAALLTIGDRTGIFTEEDGVVTIPPFIIHQFMRADGIPEGEPYTEMELVARVWSDPADGDKVIFFRNLFSLVKDGRDTLWGTVITVLSVFAVSWAHDNYLVFLERAKLHGKKGTSASYEGSDVYGHGHGRGSGEVG